VSLLKAITLLLVAAIANPMCCCLSFAEMDLEASSEASADSHACCQLADKSTQSEHSVPSGDHDCFHEEIEGSQYSDNTGFSTTISTGSSQQVVAYVDATSLYAVPQLIGISDSANSHDPCCRETGISYSQKYCVFIL
jgi:hypothetical protein